MNSLSAIEGMGLAEIASSGILKKKMWLRLGAKYHEDSEVARSYRAIQAAKKKKGGTP